MEDRSISSNKPVAAGAPLVSKTNRGARPAGTQGQDTGKSAFRQALEDQLKRTSDVDFSKHAVNRVIERKVELSEENIARLNEGVRLAGEKKLEDPLILVDRTAFLVNIRRNKVITTVDAEELRGNVFTNIDGTVII